MPTPEDIQAAAARIDGHVHTTPVIDSDAFGLGFSIALKLENTQLTGSFKVRGAFNTLRSMPVPEAGVVAASGGNHGAAVAFAARALGHAATIFVPELAGPAKIALIKGIGADLHVIPGEYSNALTSARNHEEATGALAIHAYDADATVAGQGTLMHEWESQGLDADTVLIAVGGGGLIGGALAWLQGRRKVVAVEPEAAPTMHAALAAGRKVDVDVGGVAASALGARRIGGIGFGLARSQGIESILVNDEAIVAAQQMLWSGLRQWVEPGGATALAALTSGVYKPEGGERVAVLVCGANPAPGPFD